MGANGASLDPRTPVIVGVGQVEQRDVEPTDAQEPTALLAGAARRAQSDSGATGLLDALDTVAVVRIFSWRYRDPATAVAEELGIAPARTIETDEGGNYPQALANRMAVEIQRGRADAVLIGGAEAWRSRQAARRDGVELTWTHQGTDVAPSESVASEDKLGHPGEWARQVMLPIEIYPLFDNALRADRGWSVDVHRQRLGQLWSGFSEVAETNPHAWIQRSFSPAEIREPSPTNRMVGFPYTKMMNANNAVEQAATFVMCSVERARALGIAPDRWVFPWAGTDANDHWYVSHRWSLSKSPAIRAAGRGVLDLAGVGADDIAHCDVYSCFPSAVQIAASEIGLGTDRSLTVTGGLSFAGGPWNNYVSHSIAAMVDRLRKDPGNLGLVTANGGFLTKHSFGVYGSEPPPMGFRHADHQPDVDALPRRELAEVVDGPVTVESATVMHDRHSVAQRAIVAALTPDGRRAWGASVEPDTMSAIMAEETAGRPAHLGPDGELRFT